MEERDNAASRTEREAQEAAAAASAVSAAAQGLPAQGEPVIQLHSVQDDTALVSLPLELVSVLQRAFAPLTGLPVGDLQEQLRGVAQRLAQDFGTSGGQAARQYGTAGGVEGPGEAEVAQPQSLPETSAELNRVPGAGVEELLPAGLAIDANVGEGDCRTLSTTQVAIVSSIILSKVALPAASFLAPPISSPEGLGASRDAEALLEDLDIGASIEEGDCRTLSTTQLTVMNSIILSKVALPAGVLSDPQASLMQAGLLDVPYAQQAPKTKPGLTHSGIPHTHFFSGLSMASAVPLKQLRGATSTRNLFPRLRGVVGQPALSRRRPFLPYRGATEGTESLHTAATAAAVASRLPDRRPARAAAEEEFRTALTFELSKGRSSSVSVLSVPSPLRLPVRSLLSSSQSALAHQQCGTKLGLSGASVGTAGSFNIKPAVLINFPLVGLAGHIVSARRGLGGINMALGAADAANGEHTPKQTSHTLLVTASRADDRGERRRRVAFVKCVLPVSISFRGLSISRNLAAAATRGLHSMRMERRVLRDRGPRTARLRGAAYAEQVDPSRPTATLAQLAAVQPAHVPSYLTRPVGLRLAEERRQALTRLVAASRMSATQSRGELTCQSRMQRSRANHMMRMRTLTSVPVSSGQTPVQREPSEAEASSALVQSRLPQDGDAPLIWWRGRAKLVQPEQSVAGTRQASSNATSSVLVQEPPSAAPDPSVPAAPPVVDGSLPQQGWGPNVPSPWRWQRGT